MGSMYKNEITSQIKPFTMKYKFEDIVPIILIIIGILFFIFLSGWKGVLLGIFFIVWGLNNF
jgi:hypothetical protein